MHPGAEFEESNEDMVPGLEPAEPVQASPVTAEEKKEQGNTRFKEKDWRGAIESYSEAIALNPKEPALYANRAAAYLNTIRCTGDSSDSTGSWLHESFGQGQDAQGMSSGGITAISFRSALIASALSALCFLRAFGPSWMLLGCSA